MCNLEPAARNRAAPGKTKSGGPLPSKAQMAGAGCRRRNVERVATRISHEAGAVNFGRRPRPQLGISCGGTGRGLSLSPSPLLPAPLLPGHPLYKPERTQSHGPMQHGPESSTRRGRPVTAPSEWHQDHSWRPSADSIRHAVCEAGGRAGTEGWTQRRTDGPAEWVGKWTDGQVGRWAK